MNRTFITVLTICAFAAAVAPAAEKKVQMKDLPPAVQKTVQEQTKGAEIKGLIQETEKGKTQYEVETMVSGKTRDFIVDTTGAVVEVEEEVSLDTLPAAAKAAIAKKTSGGKITHVETLTREGTTTFEVAYTKGGKKLEAGVKADGSDVK
jgi:uncharacterized membrane protein YkoI